MWCGVVWCGVVWCGVVWFVWSIRYSLQVAPVGFSGEGECLPRVAHPLLLIVRGEQSLSAASAG